MPVLQVNKDQDIAAVSSEFMQLQYKDGASWYTIEGITDYSVSGAATPTRDVVPASGGVGKRAGRARAPEVTFQSYFIPNDRHWRAMQDAYAERELYQFRIRTDGDRVFLSDASDGATFAVDAAGLVTFAQVNNGQAVPTLDNQSFGIGSIIHTGTTNYVVDAISEAGAVSVVDLDDYEAPTAVNSGVPFSIYSPAAQEYVFSAYVTNVVEASMNAEGELMTPLTLTCRKRFPKPTILTGSTFLNLTA